MIGSFQCHEHGCSALLYAPHNRLLISAGKKGDIGTHSNPSRSLILIFPHPSAVASSCVCFSVCVRVRCELFFKRTIHTMIQSFATNQVSSCFAAIIDVRQRVLHHKFQAHDSAVKCLSLDPHEEFFVSGSADGDIKVRLAIPSVMQP